MQNAETVLGVLRERGRRGLPCEELYRQMFNPQLYLLAYGRIYSNKGAMTPGATQETVDGMSLEKIGRIIDAMRHERYRFGPSGGSTSRRRTGRLRPLGLPAWSDKLVGEVMRLLLGGVLRADVLRPVPRVPARPGLPHRFAGGGQHLDRDDLVHRRRHRRLFRELDHRGHARTLAEKIHDNRFLRLVRNMLPAGYMEDWSWGATLIGAPQGGVASPSCPTSTCTSWTNSSRRS